SVGAFVGERRAAAGAEAASVAGGCFGEACDVFGAFGDAAAAFPGADIGRVGGAVSAAAQGGVIVPGPARGDVDFERDDAARAVRGGLVVGAGAGFGGDLLGGLAHV